MTPTATRSQMSSSREQSPAAANIITDYATTDYSLAEVASGRSDATAGVDTLTAACAASTGSAVIFTATASPAFASECVSSPQTNYKKPCRRYGDHRDRR